MLINEYEPRPRAGASLFCDQAAAFLIGTRTRDTGSIVPRYHFKEPQPRAGVSVIASTSPRETQAQAAIRHRRTVKRHKREGDAIALLILCKCVFWPGT